MFEFVTKHKRLIQILFVILIVPPFAFFGLESYTRSLHQADEVARVDGSSISLREYEEARRAQMERLRSVFGRGADLATLDSPQMREAVVETLVTQRLVAAEAAKSGIVISDDLLRETIQSNPAFQRDGRFDGANYRQVLLAQGMSEAAFEQRLRHDLAIERLGQSIAETAIASRTVSAEQAALEGQRREISEALIAADAFLGQVKVEEPQLKAYYEANRDRFKVPERVRVEYLVLSAADLGRETAVTEDELKAAYAAREKQYGVAEQRRASHILVKTQAEAERLTADARKSPARFAELAKKYSQDPGSAQAGGDLGQFGRGMMVKAFEDAAFAMKEGEITGPVQSEFGFHVIRLTGIVQGHSRSLEEVRKELTAELASQKGSRRFAEAAEAFGQMVYEQSDSLAPAAERFKLEVRKSDWLARQAKDAPAPFNHPKLLAALFAKDAIEARRNSDAIEVAPNVLVSARVVAHETETLRKFEDVRASIEKLLQRQEAAKLAKQDGAAKLELLAKNADPGLKWSAPRTVAVRDAQPLSADARRRIFAADAAKLPQYVGDERGDLGYAIYRVQQVIAPAARSDEQKAEDFAAAGRRAGSEQLEAWLKSQRARAKVDINRAALERK